MKSAEDMAERAHEIADRFTARRTFEEARAALNEAGMNRARQRLHDALGEIAKAQTAVREANDVRQRADDALVQADAEAMWELDSRFVVEGNKTYLVDGDERRSMTADERAKWKSLQAQKSLPVIAASDASRAANRAVDSARDALALAERAFSAARADLDAAITTARILANSLKEDDR